MRFGEHIPDLQLTRASLRTALAAAGLSTGDRYLEFGSGEGNGLIVAAQDFGAIAHGVEIQADVAALSRARIADAGLAATVVTGNALAVPLPAFDVALMYMGPVLHHAVASRLERVAAPDARVVAVAFPVPDWRLVTTRRDPLGRRVFVYQPGDRARWISWSSRPTRWNPNDASSIAIEMTAHACLADLSVQVSGPSAEQVRTRLSRTNVVRGETIVLECDVPVDAVGDRAVQIRCGDEPVGESIGI